MVKSKAASERRLTVLQERFISSGFEGLEDREIVELMISLALSPRKSKLWAKKCLEQFQDMRELLATPAEELEKMGCTPVLIFCIKLLKELPAEILRHNLTEQPAYESSKEIFDYLYYSMRDLKKEVFKVIYLNKRNQITDVVDLFTGTHDSIVFQPRQIIESSIKHRADALIFVHNHPTGDPAPSKTDKRLTRDLVYVGMVLQIKVLDHIVIGESIYFSFADEGLIQNYEDNFLNMKIRAVADTGAHYLKSPVHQTE